MALSRPAEELDAMAELGAAWNQKELEAAQRKLARVQRIAEGPVVFKPSIQITEPF